MKWLKCDGLREFGHTVTKHPDLAMRKCDIRELVGESSGLTTSFNARNMPSNLHAPAGVVRSETRQAPLLRAHRVWRRELADPDEKGSTRFQRLQDWNP